MRSQKNCRVVIEVIESKEIEVNVTGDQLSIVNNRCLLARENFESECQKIVAEFGGA
jgi:hypothetical protein